MYFTTPGATVISIFSSFFLNSFLKNKRFGRCVLSESIDIVFSLGNMKPAATDGTGVSLQVVAAALALSFPDVFSSLTEARITGLAFSHDPCRIPLCMHPCHHIFSRKTPESVDGLHCYQSSSMDELSRPAHNGRKIAPRRSDPANISVMTPCFGFPSPVDCPDDSVLCFSKIAHYFTSGVPGRGAGMTERTAS